MPFEIGSRKTASIRPLNKGMYRDVAATEIPDFGFYELQNFFPDVKGPKRRNGHSAYSRGHVFDDTPRELLNLYLANGNQVSILFTDGVLKKVFPDAEPVDILWQTDYTSIVATTGATTFSLSGGPLLNSTASYVQLGDMLRIGSESRYIDSISGPNAGTLNLAFDNDYVGSAGAIVHALPKSYKYPPDWIVFDSKLIFTYKNDTNDGDQIHPVLEYDPQIGTIGRIQPWLSNASYLIASNTPFSARTVALSQDRIYVANTFDNTEKVARYKIMWSSAINQRNFSANNYFYIPYSQGEIVRLVPLGDNLVAYTEDAIYIGIPTNDPNLPLRFEKLESANFGLVGQKAIVSFLNSHYFVSQAGFIRLDTDGKLNFIGSPVDRYALKDCASPFAIQAAVDPQNYCIHFGIPGADSNDQRIARIWTFDFRTEAWAYSTIVSTMLSVPTVNASLSIEALGTTAIGSLGTVFGGAEDAPISALAYGFEFPTVYLAQSHIILKQSDNSATDNGDDISCTLITKNMDFGEVDSTKTFLRASVKVEWHDDTPSPTDLIFGAYVSVNRGRTWKSIGQLVVDAGDDEGYVDFRILGSHLMVKLEGGAGTKPYYITQLGITLRDTGEERSLKPQT